ncbi:MAG: VCBS repeat-containing protein, partial [Thermoplasmata archaeon]
MLIRGVGVKSTFIAFILLLILMVPYPFIPYNPSETVRAEFEARDDYQVGNGPHSVFLADLDGDGFNDTVTANYYGNNVSVLINYGNGTFAPHVLYDVDFNPRALFLADLDKDMNIDIITGNIGDSDTITILFNNGDGTFGGRIEYDVGDDPRAIFAIDVGEDLNDDMDIISANYWSDDISVLKNNGDGTFANAETYGAGNGAYGICSADFDGDGYNDVATANALGDDISVLINNQDGTFANAVPYPGDSWPRSIFCADLDGVNGSDLIVANRLADNVSVFLNNDDGTFAPHVTYEVGENPLSVHAKDIDSDLDIDLVTANNMDNTVSVLKNNGNGTFALKQDYYVGAGPYSVFVADCGEDLNGDMEIICANNDADSITILFTNSPPSIEILEPDGIDDEADSSYTIIWVDSDPEDNATISLYYYNQTSKIWELIVSGIEEDDLQDAFDWNTTNMPEGEYPIKATISDSFNSHTNYSLGNVTVLHTASNIRPAISFIEPDGIDDVSHYNYTIYWIDSDPDDNAGISLFYDDDDTGGVGFWIADLDEDDADFFDWNTTFIPEGQWYIFAIIQDPWHAPVINYSSGPLIIDHPSIVPPELHDGMVMPTSGLIGDYFNFTVNYSHLHNQVPRNVILNLTGPSGGNFEMLEVDKSDKYYEDGKLFYLNISLLVGLYSHHFSAFDGTFWNETQEFLNVPFVYSLWPSLSNGNVVPSSGLDGSYFNFTVTYSDYNNDTAVGIYVNITGPSGGDFSMFELDTTDINNTDGKDYFFNTTLSAGTYSFHFAASDGTYWTETVEVVDSPIVTVGEPSLTDAEVIPLSGASGNYFNFTVNYLDPNNDAPVGVLVNITGPSGGDFMMLEVNASDTNYVDGKYYYYNLTLFEGTYSFHFSATDGIYWVETVEVSDSPEVLNNIPILSGEAVDPTQDYGGQYFNFTVVYTDLDDEPPIEITLNLTGPSGGTFIMMEEDALDINYADGKDFYYILTLDAGTYSYHFAASDGNYFIETVEVLDSPVVLNNAPILTEAIVNPAIDYSGEYFNFTVNYSDLDNDVPTNITVNITGPSGGIFTMMEVDLGDLVFTDGKLYYYNISLSAGSYSHHFAVSYGTYWNETSEVLDSPVVLSDAPVLTGGTVDPLSGYGGDYFNFTVVYTDIGNEPPSNITLNLTGPSGGTFTLIESNASDIKYDDGKEYYLKLPLSAGTYSYHFAANDSSYWVETVEVLDMPQIWNNLPSLSTDVNPETGYGGQYFNFTVVYRDIDNDPPLNVTLNLTGPSGGTINMKEINASDTYYVDGKEFFFNLSLLSGTYSHHFAANDGTYWVETVEVLDMPHVWNNLPSLSTDVNPETGYGGQYFNFTVVYSDLDNDPPLNVTLNLTGPSGGTFNMKEINVSDTYYVDGKEFFYNLSLLSGTYSHHFAANDGNDWIITIEIPDSPIVYNNIPSLSDDAVNPLSGRGGQFFNFTVVYTDFDNDSPYNITLNLSARSGGIFPMKEVNVLDTNYVDGKEYFYNLSLSHDHYLYHFAACDGNYWVEMPDVMKNFWVSNNAPSFLEWGVDPKIGYNKETFNFTVVYIDLDNEAPITINVTISGPSGGSFDLEEADSEDLNYTDGKLYYFNTILDVGSYSYKFIATDGLVWVETALITDTFQVLSDLPTLISGSVGPDTGYGGDYFNFTVIYYDIYNEPPSDILVNITGPSGNILSMIELDPNDTDITDGKLYYLNTTLSKGSYSYHFAASNGTYWTETGEVLNFPLVLNNIPSLSSDTVSPESGYGGLNFNFTVLYTDLDNDAPVSLTINLSGPLEGSFGVEEMDPYDSNYADGKLYCFIITLANGTYSYHFAATDGEYWVETLENLGLPVVLNNPPSIQITNPPAAGTTVDDQLIITWVDLDPDDDALISLYYDTDKTGYDGILIVSDISEDDMGNTFTWSTLSISNGTYYIYAVINDNVNQLVYNYSIGSVTVAHPGGEVEEPEDGKEDKPFWEQIDPTLCYISIIVLIVIILLVVLLITRRRQGALIEELVEEEPKEEVEVEVPEKELEREMLKEEFKEEISEEGLEEVEPEEGFYDEILKEALEDLSIKEPEEVEVPPEEPEISEEVVLPIKEPEEVEVPHEEPEISEEVVLPIKEPEEVEAPPVEPEISEEVVLPIKEPEEVEVPPEEPEISEEVVLPIKEPEEVEAPPV